ncbi:hypothetical protein AL435_10225 [Listeria monocytogenes]|nr:hypothetical protein [Listeria monocytogenes]EAD8922874.1 hypothetical protein [Listeria monocytogenes]EAD8999168.1 hypothetical protein [Listeria monocytogenes]EAD9003475.1 hypothetical protein [Listeria monocytogenes]
MGNSVTTRVKSTKIQENKPPFLLSVFQILPKATKLSLFWLESVMYVRLSIEIFLEKNYYFKKIVKNYFFKRKGDKNIY